MLLHYLFSSRRHQTCNHSGLSKTDRSVTAGVYHLGRGEKKGRHSIIANFTRDQSLENGVCPRAESFPISQISPLSTRQLSTR